MKKYIVYLITVMMAIALIMSTHAVSNTVSDMTLDLAVSNTAAYMLHTVQEPKVDSVGGEWAIIGLARSKFNVPESYYESYYKTVEQYVVECEGILHDKKYTEYSRVILGLTAAGYDPRNVGGYDLTCALSDFNSTVWQGINGSIFALIALDSGNYVIPNNPAVPIQATREMYIDEILYHQRSDGGWNLSKDDMNPNVHSNIDITGMALQALSRYQDNVNVKKATDKALEYLSKTQDVTGGYTYGEHGKASESTVQVLVAITSLNISVKDTRFVKNGNTLVDNILLFMNSDGSFKHTSDGCSR